jgi:hypothetical protein
MIECLNQQTAEPHYLGREITIEWGIFIDFYKSLGTFLNVDRDDEEYQKIREEGLRALQEQGYIFSHEINPLYVAFSVIY